MVGNDSHRRKRSEPVYYLAPDVEMASMVYAHGYMYGCISIYVA